MTLPGEFLDAPEPPPDLFLRRLCSPHHSQPLPPLHNRDTTGTGVPEVLFSSKFVFVRQDAVTRPLSPLYHGPYLVLKHGPKFFRLQVGTREETVSVDRLKPCFSSDPDLIPALPPRRGRPSRPGPAVPQQPVLLPRRPRGRPRRLPLEISVPSPRRL